MEELKPIHKFNGGRGATLCHTCRVIISEGFTHHLYCEKCSGVPTHTYKLIKDDNRQSWNSNDVRYIKWNEDGSFKELLEEPELGCSIVLDARNGGQFSWMTTAIQEFKKLEDKIIFTTRNSIYILFKNR